jgi:hypothetical protein
MLSYPVAPWIAKVKEGSFDLRDAGGFQSATSGLLIVYDETEMTTVVGGLFTSLLQSNELIAKIDERHLVVLAAQLEFEQVPVKGQGFVDISHF